MSFRTTTKGRGPRWLVGPGTEADGSLDETTLINYSHDLMLDAYAERARLGHLARFPQNGPNGETAPADALEAIGRDRRMIRGIFETASEYAARLLTWLDERKTAGNPFTLMRQLAAYCGPLPSFRTVDCRGNWYSRAANGTQSALIKQGNWNWDGEEATRWSRFWVICYPNGLWTTTTQEYGDGSTWGDGHNFGCTITQEQKASLQFLINDWKPAGTRCSNIILAFDSASFDPSADPSDPGMPDGLWGGWSKNVGGVQVSSRLATARYLGGV